MPFARLAQFKILDVFYKLGHSVQPEPKLVDSVIIAGIDDLSLETVPDQWPWPRSLFADILESIEEQGPKLICLDLMLSGKSRDSREDRTLSETISKYDNIFTVSYMSSDGTYVKPYDGIRSSGVKTGFVNTPSDMDGVTRSVWLAVKSPAGSILDYSLAVKIASFVNNITPGELLDKITGKNPDSVYFNYSAADYQLRFIPIAKIYKKNIPGGVFRDKIVLLGVTSKLFHDIHRTPIGPMHGVQVLANTVLSLALGKTFSTLPAWVEFLILYFVSFVCIRTILKFRPGEGIFLCILLSVIFLTAGFHLFLHHVIMDYFGALFSIFCIAFFYYTGKYAQIISENSRLHKEASIDSLTQLNIYKYFELKLKREFLALKQDKKLSVILIDIDNFKAINDNYGHESGNQVIRQFARILKSASRQDDFPARFGGDEFCVLIKGLARPQLEAYAGRIMEKFGRSSFSWIDNGQIKFTVSIGIALYSDFHPGNYLEMLKCADKALYRAKEEGKNRVCFYAS